MVYLNIINKQTSF